MLYRRCRNSKGDLQRVLHPCYSKRKRVVFHLQQKIFARTVINQLTWTGRKKNSWWVCCVFFPVLSGIDLVEVTCPSLQNTSSELLAIWIPPLEYIPCAARMASFLLSLGDISWVKSWWKSRSGSRKDGDWWFSGNAAPEILYPKLLEWQRHQKVKHFKFDQVFGLGWLAKFSIFSSSHITFHHDFSRDIFQKHSDF